MENTFALVTGGSKGIGFAIATALARRGYNLVLVASHQEALEKAKSVLASTYPIKVEIIVKDLSCEESATEIAAWCSEKSIPLKMLCNVAGFGGAKDYLSLPLETLQRMVRLNLETVMSLSLTLLSLLEKNAPSHILNVASMAGFAPIPVKNLYSATKAGVISFSLALRYQLKKRSINVSCLCPGPVFTKPEIEKDTLDKLGWFGKQMAVAPASIGEIAIEKTLAGKMIIVPGKLAKITSMILRILPRKAVLAIYNGF